MTRKEYLIKLNDLNFKIKMLKDEYITSNNCIPPGNYVIVTCNGKEERYYLKEYNIINGYIKPVFNKCSESGKRLCAYITVTEFPDNITMRLV